MSSAADFKKLTQREHVLKRPDTYIGSTDVNPECRWVYDAVTSHMTYRRIALNPGLYKIFDEILVNARDAWVRGTEAGRNPIKHIDIAVERTDINNATIRVSNDGDGIPVEIHAEERCYVGELIFGHLLTSNNYNDDENASRITGGKNGFGAKLTNIFSRRFTLTTVDTANGKKYTQTWRNNMTVCEPPTIKRAGASAKGLVTLEWEPDFDRFPGGMSDDMMAVFHTRAVELAAVVGSGVKVSFNGQTISANTFEKFTKLFLREGVSGIAYEHAGERWEVAAVLASQLYMGDGGGECETPEERSISFVNGINTRKGGKHVDLVVRNVLGDFCEAAKKKRLDIKPGQLKDAVVFLVNTTIVNPAFDSQTKECLTTPANKFGSSPRFSGKIVEQLGKLGLFDEAASILEAKAAKEAKKTDGKKRQTLHGLPKLVDALWAGTARSTECTLILTEGDSAATSAISGLAVVGRERYGVFPLRGKLLNVKDISLQKFNANEELTAIKRILGLEHGKVYSDTRTLRYGRVMVMADQDHDGSHIKGLLMNLFHTEWPSLLRIGFLCSLLTPIIKASRGSVVESFYSIPAFEEWRQERDLRGWHVKYYKGLGTSTPMEAREWFQRMNDIAYVWERDSDSAIHLAFNKKKADDRKMWLSNYDATRQLDVAERRVPFERFIHDELIHFSNADNIRSLPSLMDGLKPSQRKILFACLKRNLRSEIRVAQLAGYVSEHAAYHHGEASLNSTIVGMAQTFVGANNINLLKPIGQFGSRLLGGKDASSPRYIHTYLERIVDLLFRKEDAGILEHLDDDGQLVEPKYYLPVVPLVTLNGCVGIGTGFSTNIPPYNPAQIVSLLKMRLSGSLGSLAGRDLDPYWHGFRGALTRSDAQTWMTHGIYELNDDEHTITITELPIGTWSHDYKGFLDSLFVGGAAGAGAGSSSQADSLGLRSFDDLYNDRDVRFVLYFTQDGYYNFKTAPEDFEKTFRLTETHKTTNMCCFDADGHIVKYATVGDMLEAFFEKRFEGYVARKAALLAALEKELVELRARRKFIQLVLDEEIVIARKEDEEIVAAMKEHELPPLSEPAEPEIIKAYEYLLRMRLDRLKASAVTELTRQVDEAEAAYEELRGTAEATLWLRDLEAFSAGWQDMIEERDAEAAAGPASAGGGTKKTIKRRKGVK